MRNCRVGKGMPDRRLGADPVCRAHAGQPLRRVHSTGAYFLPRGSGAWASRYSGEGRRFAKARSAFAHPTSRADEVIE
jgi:hypothetical protein